MKKLFLLASAALLLSGTANARQWKFNNWSSATVAQVKVADDWTNDEKGDNSTNVVPDDACVWNVGANVAAACDENGNLLAGGAVIAELEGLKWSALGAKKIAIAFDYGTTTDSKKWGPYEGGSYLWLNGKTTAVHFTIPAVAPGTEITMGLESHKPSEARGIDLYVNGTKVDKDPSDYPTTYAEYTWIVPGEEGGDPVDVDVQPSNGCHIYFINVKEGDDDIDAGDVKVAYLYDGTYNTTTNGYGYGVNGGLNEDPIWNNPVQSYSAQAIDLAEATQTLTTDELNDSLINFDVVVLSEAVGSGNKYAKALNGIINFVPMLNLKAYMYKNWGFGAGANPSPKATAVKVGEDYLDSELFADVDIDDEGNITLFDCEDVSTLAGGNLVQGYTATAGKLFADDEVIATVGSNNAIHTHGTKNQYMLIPLSSDNLNLIAEPALTLVYNAISVLAKTKSKVQNAAAPIISQAQANNETTVTIASTTAGATIYYTVDGTEPTEASPVYSEPFTVTVDSTVVKAFAIAHGYNNSDVTTATVRVFSQAAAPAISVTNGDGATTITLSQADGEVIYYSFSGVTSATQSATYAEPIVVNEPGTIYAFTAPEGALASEMVSLDFVVGGIPAVKDTVAHFTANQTDWFDNAVLHVGEESATVADAVANGNQFGASGTAKAIYYFGKSSWSYYDKTVIDSTVVLKDENGEVIKCADGVTDSTKVYYHPDANALKYITSNTDAQWVIKSYGQVITGETSEGSIMGIGNGTAGRYANSAIDEIGGIPSKGFIDFGGKGSGDPYSMSFESTSAFAAGEYDVVVYLGNGSTGNPIIALQTSADGENWTSVVDTLNYTTKQRYYRKTRKHLTFTEPQYIRAIQVSGSNKGYIYDIYVITTDGTTGIRAIENTPAVVTNGVFYNVLGQQVDKNYKGLVIRGGKKMILR
jgi:hypothetical protein